MILRSSPPSPFGRFTRIAAHVLGLHDQITVEFTDTNDANDTIRTQNPLGKIPALILSDDHAIYDSRVIAEYMDSLAGGGKLIPASGDARYDVLTQAALATGILDAAILVLYEARFRPEDMQVDAWLDYQRGKISRALTALGNQNLSYTNGAMPNMAEIIIACVLDYLDYRKQANWRDFCPNMEQWITDFAAAVPGYKDTLPEDIDPAPWR